MYGGGQLEGKGGALGMSIYEGAWPSPNLLSAPFSTSGTSRLLKSTSKPTSWHRSPFLQIRDSGLIYT